MSLISVDEAWGKIKTLANPLPTEVRRLDEAAGCVLAQPVRAPVDLPPFDNSAMDGYALRAVDTQEAKEDKPKTVTLTGEVAAGGWMERAVAPGTAVKIMTGAPVPAGADTVLMVEDGRLRSGAVEIRSPLPVGKHVRRRGEDVRCGEELIAGGLRLNPQRLGLLGNSGIAEVTVHRRLRASLLATGSELALAGSPLEPGKIYDSNRLVLRTLVDRTGSFCEDLGVAPDDPELIRERIRLSLASDLLLISGGVSVGEHDYVKEVLKDLGMETIFWRVRMKPGKPILCGRIGEQWVFGLPGNPISCVVGFLVFIEPLIRRLQGETETKLNYIRARLTKSVRKADDRALYMTAHMENSSEGGLKVTPTEKQGSAMMQSLAQANCFVAVPEAQSAIEAGEEVDVIGLE